MRQNKVRPHLKAHFQVAGVPAVFGSNHRESCNESNGSRGGGQFR